MVIKELLARDVPVTCTCGWQFTVERTQAGMACNCPECGELLDVPQVGRGFSWATTLAVAVVLLGGLFAFAYFTAAPVAAPVTTPEKPLLTGKSLAKGTTTPPDSQVDEIPFVSEPKFIPKNLPTIIDSNPAGDPFVAPSVGPIAQAPTKSAAETSSDPTRTTPGTANIALDEAVAAFRRNDVPRTQEILKDARIRFPELPPATFMLAELYLTHNMTQPGRAELEKVAVEDPKYPGTYLMFGNLALAEGRTTDAQLLFERAESLESEIKDPERKKTLQGSVRSGKVSVYEARKNWPAVIAAANEWLEIDPKSLRARQRLARAYLAKGQLKEATEELVKARKEDKAGAIPDVALAMFHTEFADLKSAEECLLRAAKEYPKDAKVQHAVAGWYLQQDRAKEGQPFISESLKIDPTSTEARYLAGMIARQVRDYKTAESSFEAVLRDAPANFPASNQLALVLSDQEEESKRRRAMEMAEVNARQYPRNSDAVATLGWVYYRAGKLDEAEKALQSAVSNGRATSDIAYYLAHVMADRGRIDDAAKLLQGALKSPGTFTFRKEAQVWLDRITSKPKK